MFSSEQNEIRQIIFTAWGKHLEKKPINQLEAQIIDVVLSHPEYHDFFSHPAENQFKTFSDENPFFHIGLHLTLREQIATDRPQGIKAIFEKLKRKCTDAQIAEHAMLSCLEEILWEAQANQAAPSENEYLANLQKL